MAKVLLFVENQYGTSHPGLTGAPTAFNAAGHSRMVDVTG
jgi:hypothetical protein